MTSIIERRTLSEDLQSNLWSSFIISFQTSKEYFDNVFSIFVCSKLETNFKTKGKKNLALAVFEKSTEKYLKIVRYCS